MVISLLKMNFIPLDCSIISKILIVLVSFSFLGCTHLFYHPEKKIYITPKRVHLKYKELNFKSSDNTQLHAWHIFSKKELPESEKNLILFFHGNAQNLSTHFVSLHSLAKLYNFDYIIMDYRGYGKSEGEPNPVGVNEDALSAMNLAHNIFKRKNYKRLIIYGQSLGGAISLNAFESFKHKKDVSLLVLDSTFLSYKKIAFDKLTSSWITFLFSPIAFFLISDKTSPKDFVSKLQVPALVIHGKRDRIVPYKFGEEIYEDLTTKKKWFWTIPWGFHTDVFMAHKGIYRKKFNDLVNTL